MTPSIATSPGEDIVLECNISYPTAQDLANSNATLIWSTELTYVALYQNVTAMDRYLVSQLPLSSVNSSYCGRYVCTARDSFVAQPTADSAMVQVGKYNDGIFFDLGFYNLYFSVSSHYLR